MDIRVRSITPETPSSITAAECPTAASLTLENDRLRSELNARYAELRALRARVAEVADTARKEIERNLHDGTQQRLVSLAMSLSRLEDKLPHEPAAAKPIAREARQVLAVTLAELRELSNELKKK